MPTGYVSEAVIRRLPSYYRHLGVLAREGVAQISSQELGNRMQLTASQIRQDINCFGGFGRQGYGYHVQSLREHIGHILGVDQVHQMIIVGSGNIGRAVARSDSFRSDGFQTIALFDCDPEKIGKNVDGLIVQDLESLQGFLKTNKVDIAVIAVPLVSAQTIVNNLLSYGVKGFWNFAPVDLQLPDDASVVNVHLDEGLEILSFRLLQQQ